jgi:hypothetical protein
MRFKDMRDVQPFFLGDADVFLHVARGINHDNLLGFLIAYQIGSNRQSWYEALMKEHDLVLLLVGGTRCAVAGISYLIPRHFGEQHRHAAGIRNSRKRETSAHESC